MNKDCTLTCESFNTFCIKSVRKRIQFAVIFIRCYKLLIMTSTSKALYEKTNLLNFKPLNELKIKGLIHCARKNFPFLLRVL